MSLISYRSYPSAGPIDVSLDVARAVLDGLYYNGSLLPKFDSFEFVLPRQAKAKTHTHLGSGCRRTAMAERTFTASLSYRRATRQKAFSASRRPRYRCLSWQMARSRLRRADMTRITPTSRRDQRRLLASYPRRQAQGMLPALPRFGISVWGSRRH